MWAELLPKLIGGTITDSDAPNKPTEITGFKLDEKWVEIEGKDFNFGGCREFMGIGTEGAVLIVRSPWMSARVTLPKKSE